MFSYFLNPWMLLGLIGLSLPVLAHLLSKKRYDIVHWGAMQFLELSPNARRKLKLEQLLLLLLRMALIALIVFALARPFASGRLFSFLTTGNNRDVVLIIDGSYSMGWEGDGETPHRRAQQKAAEILEELSPGDTIALIDARDQVRTVIETPIRDFSQVQKALDQLPAPSGSTNLNAAVNKAITLLANSTNPQREIIVLTDGQSIGWKANDENLWLRVKDLREQVPIPSRLWVWDVTKDQEKKTNPDARLNFQVEKLTLSRELIVPMFPIPIRIQTKIHYHAGGNAKQKKLPNVERNVSLKINGELAKDGMQTVRLEPNGEASVEFEYQFDTPGSHVVSVVLDGDNLPGDNRADAAVTVAKAIPVLLVEGNPNPESQQTETHYLRAALSPSKLTNPLIQTKIVPWDKFQARDLEKQNVVVLADVPRLSAPQIEALKTFVSNGGGLLIALGDGVQSANYNGEFYQAGQGLLPAKLERVQSPPMGEASVNVRDSSLELAWLAWFRQDGEGEFEKVRFEKWWKVTPAPNADGDQDAGAETNALSTPIVAARLETHDPLLLTRTFGKGSVMLLTSPLDAASNWNTLRARQLTFVPLVYEMVFQLTSPNTVRNVKTGTPLVVEVPRDLDLENFVFAGPDEKTEHIPKTQPASDGRLFVRLEDTQLPGVYEFRPKRDAAARASIPVERFVVDFDREESNLAPLSKEEQELLESDENTQFTSNIDSLMEGMTDDSQQAELFRLLMVVFLVILVGEVVMTRRLVQGGHMDGELNPQESE